MYAVTRIYVFGEARITVPPNHKGCTLTNLYTGEDVSVGVMAVRVFSSLVKATRGGKVLKRPKNKSMARYFSNSIYALNSALRESAVMVGVYGTPDGGYQLVELSALDEEEEEVDEFVEY